ncbi:MAG: RNA polymerase sigma factor SigZ [Bacteroidota bacterium]|nr:RNA polymerase sigma factor SigZ [Bacteroidota bacterium]
MEKSLVNIWNLFNKDLYKFIFSRVKDSDAAKDILQDTFIKIQTNISSLNEEKSLKFWIYKITYHSIIDYFRKSKYDKEDLNDDFDYEDKLEKNDNEDKTSELSECIVPFINKLPGIYKEALTLTEFKHYSQLELAEYLGISYSGAKSRVQRAKVKLKEIFQECCTISYDSYGNILDYKSKHCKKPC